MTVPGILLDFDDDAINHKYEDVSDGGEMVYVAAEPRGRGLDVVVTRWCSAVVEAAGDDDRWQWSGVRWRYDDEGGTEMEMKVVVCVDGGWSTVVLGGRSLPITAVAAAGKVAAVAVVVIVLALVVSLVYSGVIGVDGDGGWWLSGGAWHVGAGGRGVSGVVNRIDRETGSVFGFAEKVRRKKISTAVVVVAAAAVGNERERWRGTKV
nr:hypothetical protein [Tanacetum cinerariifolium]